MLSSVAEASLPLIASPTSEAERAIATACVSGACVAVASTVTSPFPAVTVADDTNALTALSIVFEICEMPVAMPAKPAATATPTTLPWTVDVSSALTVTKVPAWIVPPVRDASTVMVVVLVPSAATAAPLTEKSGEIETATAAAAGFETIVDVSVVFTTSEPEVAVTSAPEVAARIVPAIVFVASASAIEIAAAEPSETATETDAAVAFEWIELASSAVTLTSVPAETPLPSATSEFETSAVATPWRWFVVDAAPAATAPPKSTPAPTATPTPTASTVIDGCVATATVSAVPAETFDASIVALTVLARSFVAIATETEMATPAPPTATETETAVAWAVMLPPSVAFTSTVWPAETSEEPVTAAATVEVRVFVAIGTLTATLSAITPAPMLTATAVGVALIVATSSAVTRTAPSGAATWEASILAEMALPTLSVAIAAPTAMSNEPRPRLPRPRRPSGRS